MAHTTTFNSAKYLQTLKPGSVSNAKGSQAPCDRENKKGLLPRDNISVYEGSKIYHNPGASTMTKGGGNSISISTTVGIKSHELRAAAVQSGNGSGGYIQGVRDGPTVKDSRRAVKDKKLEKELRKEILEGIVKSDKGKTVGGQYILAAEKMKKSQVEKNGKEVVGKDKEKDKKKRKRGESESEEEEDDETNKRRRPFTNSAVRLIGYDPTLTADSERDEDDETKRSRVSFFSLSFPLLRFLSYDFLLSLFSSI